MVSETGAEIENLTNLVDELHSAGDWNAILGGGFEYFFIFTPKIGEMIQFDYIIFFTWVEATN